jgi:hypothetical protein
MTTITAPSGRKFTYQPAGDPERIKALVTLLCDSLTEDGDSEQFVDNMFQAATSLFMELGESTDANAAVLSVQQGLSAWITRKAPEDGE